MIEKLAWNTFKKTGNIKTYLELSSFREMENSLKVNLDENNKSEWNNNSRT